MGKMCRGGWVVAAFFLAVPGVRADEDARKEILELNNITGKDTLRAVIASLGADEKKARLLLKEGLDLVKAPEKPLNYNTVYILARVAGNLKDLKASETFYRVCIQEAVKFESSGKLSESYGELIVLHFRNRQYAESAKLCREVLELNDGTGQIYYLAYTTAKGGTGFREPTNINDFARGLRLNAHGLLIRSLTMQGQFDQALKMVEKRLEAARNHWLEKDLQAWVLREAGKIEEAARVYEDILAKVKKDPDLEEDEREEYLESYRLTLSNVYVELKQIDKATEQLQALLAKKPDDPGYNNDLGYIWADHDMKLEEAEKLIRKALDLDRKRRQADPAFRPETDHDNGAYLDSLGWVLFKQKKFKEARDILLKAVADKSTQHIEIYDHLGDVYEALGDREAAIAAWRKGLEVAGDSRRDQERKTIVEKKLAKNQK